MNSPPGGQYGNIHTMGQGKAILRADFQSDTDGDC